MLPVGWERMKPRLLLSLVTMKVPRRRPGGSGPEAGFSFAAVLVVMLIVLSGTLALAIRGGSGSLASAYQSQTLEARAAAESGATQIIAELNKLPNRRMLVSGRPLTGPTNSWRNPVAPGGGVDPQQQNPCTTATPTQAARDLAEPNRWNDVRPNSSDHQFRLRSVRYLNSARNPNSYNNSNDGEVSLNTAPLLLGLPRPDRSYIQLVVEGKVSRSGTDVATATIVKEFEVIPKCCNRSFMGPAYSQNSPSDPEIGPQDQTGANGSDGFDCAYSLPGNLSLATFARSEPGAGVLSGGIQNATGLSLQGVQTEPTNPPTFRDAPFPSVICFVVGNQNCTTSFTEVNNALTPNPVPIIPVSIQIPRILYPSWNANPSPFTSPTTEAPPIYEFSTQNTYPNDTVFPSIYLQLKQLNPTDVEIYACELDSSSPPRCINPPQLFANSSGQRYCGRATDPSLEKIANFHCRLSAIDMSGGRKIIVNTQDRDLDPRTELGRIVFYFQPGPAVLQPRQPVPPNPQIPSPPSRGQITISSIDGLQHVKCPYSDIGPCTNLPRPDQFSNFQILSSGNSDSFTLGGNSSPLHIFAFLRNGSIRVNGNVSLVGALWARNMSLNGGSINFRGITPFSQGISGTPGQPVFDWVARSVTRTQYYGN